MEPGLGTRDRLAVVEAELVRLKRSFALGFAFLLAGAVGPLVFYVWSMSRYAPGGGELGDVVRARRVVLADDHGRQLAELGIREGRPALVIYGDDGDPLTTLDGDGLAIWGPTGVARTVLDGEKLGIADDAGRRRVVLAVEGDHSRLEVSGAGGWGTVRLGALAAGPRLEIEGDDGKPRLVAGARGVTSNFALMDAKGRERAGIGVTENGAHLRLRDEKGGIRMILRSGSEGGSGLDLYDERDRVRLLAGVGLDGSPSIEFVSGDTLRLPDAIEDLGE